MLLKQYIKDKLITESMSSEIDIAKSLRAVTFNVANDVDQFNDIQNDIFNLLLDKGFDVISSTDTRDRIVFSKDNLPYVIKVAKRIDTAITNKNEVQNFDRSLNLREVLPHLFSYDTENENPLWVIFEKVIPLNVIGETNPQQIYNILPTFSALSNDKNPQIIIDLAVDSLTIMYSQHENQIRKNVRQLRKLRDEQGNVITDEFVDVFCSAVYETGADIDQSLLKDLMLLKVDVGDDIKKFKRCIQYDFTGDLHEENIGVRDIPNPSAEDIVILDFDIDV